ncbi:MAG: cation-translocating P-type ATPase [Salegentibacter sp.]
MLENNLDIKGLTKTEVLRSREKHGPNRYDYKKESGFLYVIKNLAGEPMVILLLVTSSVYFLSGNTGDGIFLAAAIVLVSAISLYQDSRSRNAQEKLKAYTQPNCKVIRDGETRDVKSEDIVVGDFLIVEEGTSVAADGIIVHSNDFSVNESILTGEAYSVYKDKSEENNKVYKGTMVSGGLAIVKVTAVGNETKFGEIGKSLEALKGSKTPLELQINNFVKKMVVAGTLIFLIVWLINYLRNPDLLDSLLKGLTLAMSILPEEIPVAFTTFMAMGAWRLMKAGVVVKQMKTVESLGSATVLCVDKTGTITENRMSLAEIYTAKTDSITDSLENLTPEDKDLLRTAMWASEPIPFDPMEKALHKAYEANFPEDERLEYKMIHEYPLDGKPPMMTHIFANPEGQRIIAAKGATEALLAVSHLPDKKQQEIKKRVGEMARKGYRVLAVGISDFGGQDFPEKQQELPFNFLGLVAFFDPPKKNITNVFQQFYDAGIKIKIITGDNAETTMTIARQTGFRDHEKSLSGEELMEIKDGELSKKVSETMIFTRMFPDAKLKIIKALKEGGEVVAMTGDGVNDGPALKAAHIGVAMGKKGTEIAKDSASLILVDDDLSKMLTAVAMGRKIYTNLKKAIQYIISIHIPIILTVFLPLALGWIYPNIFSPVHIIFLELIMGPTCSIIYENEPMEEHTMQKKPRPLTSTFFNWKELTTSVIQGLAITAGSLGMYSFATHHGYSEDLTRTTVFSVLIIANIFLTLINRSFYFSLLRTLKYKNKLVPLIIAITITIWALLLFVGPFTRFFQFVTPGPQQLLISLTFGFGSTIWFEIVKFWRRRRKPSAKETLNLT